MTREEAIKLANDMAFMASIWVDDEGNEVNALVKFAKLVAAKEREEIAQFIEKTHLGSLPEETAVHYALLLKSYSTAIRARGET